MLKPNLIWNLRDEVSQGDSEEIKSQESITQMKMKVEEISFIIYIEDRKE